jgi:hypothetical protein
MAAFEVTTEVLGPGGKVDNLPDMTANAHPAIAVFIELRRERIQMWTEARRAVAL